MSFDFVMEDYPNEIPAKVSITNNDILNEFIPKLRNLSLMDKNALISIIFAFSIPITTQVEGTTENKKNLEETFNNIYLLKFEKTLKAIGTETVINYTTILNSIKNIWIYRNTCRVYQCWNACSYLCLHEDDSEYNNLQYFLLQGYLNGYLLISDLPTDFGTVRFKTSLATYLQCENIKYELDKCVEAFRVDYDTIVRDFEKNVIHFVSDIRSILKVNDSALEDKIFNIIMVSNILELAYPANVYNDLINGKYNVDEVLKLFDDYTVVDEALELPKVLAEDGDFDNDDMESFEDYQYAKDLSDFAKQERDYKIACENLDYAFEQLDVVGYAMENFDSLDRHDLSKINNLKDYSQEGLAEIFNAIIKIIIENIGKIFLFFLAVLALSKRGGGEKSSKKGGSSGGVFFTGVDDYIKRLEKQTNKLTNNGETGKLSHPMTKERWKAIREQESGWGSGIGVDETTWINDIKDIYNHYAAPQKISKVDTGSLYSWVSDYLFAYGPVVALSALFNAEEIFKATPPLELDVALSLELITKFKRMFFSYTDISLLKGIYGYVSSKEMVDGNEYTFYIPLSIANKNNGTSGIKWDKPSVIKKELLKNAHNVVNGEPKQELLTGLKVQAEHSLNKNVGDNAASHNLLNDANFKKTYQDNKVILEWLNGTEELSPKYILNVVNKCKDLVSSSALDIRVIFETIKLMNKMADLESLVKITNPDGNHTYAIKDLIYTQTFIKNAISSFHSWYNGGGIQGGGKITRYEFFKSDFTPVPFIKYMIDCKAWPLKWAPTYMKSDVSFINDSNVYKDKFWSNSLENTLIASSGWSEKLGPDKKLFFAEFDKKMVYSSNINDSVFRVPNEQERKALEEIINTDTSKEESETTSMNKAMKDAGESIYKTHTLGEKDPTLKSEYLGVADKVVVHSQNWETLDKSESDVAEFTRGTIADIPEPNAPRDTYTTIADVIYRATLIKGSRLLKGRIQLVRQAIAVISEINSEYKVLAYYKQIKASGELGK